ncbi:hypothetical protein [Nostoc sp.]|uniref:hypothetical protein n=1 Tax=Nostoc sp. TaxID=1180 RepID=UPI002FF4D526
MPKIHQSLSPSLGGAFLWSGLGDAMPNGGKLTFSNTTVFRYYYSNLGKHKATLTFTISKFG